MNVSKDNLKQEIRSAEEVILAEISEAFHLIDVAQINVLIDQLNRAQKIFLCGVGRVEIALAAWCKRLAHLGYRVCMVGALTEPHFGPGDLLIVGSGSGNSLIPVAIARKAKSLGGSVFHIGSNPAGEIAASIDCFLRIPVRNKTTDGSGDGKVLNSAQLMTSLFEQVLFLLGDVVALSVARRQGRHPEQYWTEHASLE